MLAVSLFLIGAEAEELNKAVFVLHNALNTSCHFLDLVKS